MCDYLGFRRGILYDKPARGRGQLSDEQVLGLLKQARGRQLTWGIALLYAQLKQQGLSIGKTRAYRLYRQAKLSLHRSVSKPRLKRAYQERLMPQHINEGWAVDFMSEWVVGPNQQRVRILNVVDERSRRDLWIEAAPQMTAAKLVEALTHIGETRCGWPRYLRCDNGPELISRQLKTWAQQRGIALCFIQPGKPTQNGIIERLNGTVRKECLNLNWFYSLDEVNDLLGRWFNTYNFERPHSSLHYKTPVAFEALNQHLYYKMDTHNRG